MFVLICTVCIPFLVCNCLFAQTRADTSLSCISKSKYLQYICKFVYCICVFTSIPTHLLAHVLLQRKTCWQKSLHVCFVNAVCLGVKCHVYMQCVSVCVCRGARESEHVCTCCELLGPWPSCSPLLEGVGCRQ